MNKLLGDICGPDDEKSHRRWSGCGRRGRPRCGAKNLAILEAAVALFLEYGFDGTSMDAVAKSAGVSKQTVYSHFESKEQLFGAAIDFKISEYFPETALVKVDTHTLEDDLFVVARQYADLLLGEEGMAIFRVLVMAAPKGSKLAEIFWQAGPTVMLQRIVAYLQVWVDKGELTIEDPTEAAMMFVNLLKGNLHFLRSIGLIDEITDEMKDLHAKKATEAFLTLYRSVA